MRQNGRHDKIPGESDPTQSASQPAKDPPRRTNAPDHKLTQPSGLRSLFHFDHDPLTSLSPIHTLLLAMILAMAYLLTSMWTLQSRVQYLENKLLEISKETC